MLAYPASLLNIDLVILDPLPNAPAKQVLNPDAQPNSNSVPHIDGSFSDSKAIAQLASQVDILTVEIEHVNVDALEETQKASSKKFDPAIRKVEVQPAPSTLRTIQDKYLQKEWLHGHSIPVAPYLIVEGGESGVKAVGEKLGYPFMLKSRTLAYDGRGNYVVKSAEDATSSLEVLGAGPNIDASSRRTLYAEKWVPFDKEIAVMVVRGKNGEVRSYPPVETVHRDSICHLVFAPLRASDTKVSRYFPSPIGVPCTQCIFTDYEASEGVGREGDCYISRSRCVRCGDVLAARR